VCGPCPTVLGFPERGALRPHGSCTLLCPRLTLARAFRPKRRTMILGSVATLAVAAVGMAAVTLFATSSVSLLSKTHTLVSERAHG
jgi:hypothetical protein